MKNPRFLSAVTILVMALTLPMQGQPLVNLGLVGVGRLPADTLDVLGQDTLGGVFSGMWLDPASIAKAGDTYTASIYATPDRGFGSGATDFHPRIHKLSVAITPYYGAGPITQDQIVLANTDTHILMQGASTFTGANPDDTNHTAYPKSLDSGIGGGKWSLDPEGVAFAGDGVFYISDEYGPFLYRFDNLGQMLLGMVPPAAYLPRLGSSYPRTINFLTMPNSGTNSSGRFVNRGYEGVAITPDGKKMVAVMQASLSQDGDDRNRGRNARILVLDLDSASPTFLQPVAEYIYQLTLNGNTAGNRVTGLSEILALSDARFVLIERDGIGLGGDPGPIVYKRIILADTSAASNLLAIPGTPYDLEREDPAGQLNLPRSGLPAGLKAVARQDLVDLLNVSQLAKYGLNVNTVTPDTNTVCEKWEGLARIPLNDPAAPSDYLLLVGNDNDFSASVVYHNGVPVGTNTTIIDTMLLAFRIGEDHTPPTVTCPTLVTRVAAFTNCSLPDVTTLVAVTDNSAAPVKLTQNPAVGSAVSLETPVAIAVTATDAAGNQASCDFNAIVYDGPPSVRCPGNITTTNAPGQCSATVNYTATASDNCSTPTLACEPQSGSTFPVGSTLVTCTATDSLGQTATCSFTVTVKDSEAPLIVGVTPSQDQLWPPNQRMVAVTLAVNVTDNCEGAPACLITEVTSSEPETGPTDFTAPDWEVTGPLSVNLRAERLNTGPGRIYTITVKCTDAAGNSATKKAMVTVPHDQGRRSSAEL